MVPLDANPYGSHSLNAPLRIGNRKLFSAVPEDVSQAVFYVTESGIRWRPLAAADVESGDGA